MLIYEVKLGDTLTAISQRYDVSVERLIQDNGLERPEHLTPGQVLLILFSEEIYTTVFGDTVFGIAERFGVSPKLILRNNPWIAQSEQLLAGTVLTIRFMEQEQRPIRVNGYAYPYISLPLLRRTLPFLSTLTIFGYGFTDSGELIPPDDEPLLALAKEYSVAPFLLLSSITESGNFSSERAKLLFTDQNLQYKVLSSLIGIMHEKGYRGMDIDFEYVDAENTADFLNFLRTAAEMLHENGFFLHVDLAPKTSADQPGLLYEAHDYAAIGEIADTVLLMTYEWGYTYGPPMAVAPFNQVERVVSYGLSEIPADKILLGVPNYGYDWTLPFEKGITKAVSIGNQYAVAIASDNGVPIQYDFTAQSPWFTYRREQRNHIVWFEDARSIDAKFSLLTRNNLLGVGYWNLMRPFAQCYSLQNMRFAPAQLE